MLLQLVAYDSKGKFDVHRECNTGLSPYLDCDIERII